MSPSHLAPKQDVIFDAVSFVIFISRLTVSEHWQLLLIIKVIVFNPVEEYECEGSLRIEVLPSPKSQK